jgi:tRNA(His) 5'-end guanylyltransferase
MEKMTLGDRCKALESAEADRRAMPALPLLARLDGRAFHTFTRGLPRPYDERLTRCLIETTAHLVGSFEARVGYTQSDEITLLWWEPERQVGRYPFDGRYQKLASVLAGSASAFFARIVAEAIPQKRSELPCFDGRVWQVPTLDDALEVFVWREDDATKNSISMAASAFYSTEELEGVVSSEKHDLLHRKGVNWNDYPSSFKRGTYVQRRTMQRALSEADRLRIPEPHRPAPGHLFERSEVVALDLPPIRRVGNALEVLLNGATPTTREE